MRSLLTGADHAIRSDVVGGSSPPRERSTAMNKRIAGRAAAVGAGIALMLAAALVLVPGRAAADPNNASGTWELHLEVPNVAMASRAAWSNRPRSVPLGRYWRSSPLVFSLVPRCQGLRGSQK